MSSPTPQPTPSDEPPGHPVGQAIRWTPGQVELLAQVTAQDEERARRVWRDHSGDGMSSLLDAKSQQP